MRNVLKLMKNPIFCFFSICRTKFFLLSFCFFFSTASIFWCWGVGGYLESNPFSSIEFLSRERLRRVTISRDKARSNRWCQSPELFRTYITSVTEIMAQGIFQNRHRSKSSISMDRKAAIVGNLFNKNEDVSFSVQFQSRYVNFLYDQSSLSRMTNAYIYLVKAVLEPGTSRLAARCLNHSDT